jgi:hypothetical protein
LGRPELEGGPVVLRFTVPAAVRLRYEYRRSHALTTAADTPLGVARPRIEEDFFNRVGATMNTLGLAEERAGPFTLPLLSTKATTPATPAVEVGSGG